jgi:hypothetical protein
VVKKEVAQDICALDGLRIILVVREYAWVAGTDERGGIVLCPKRVPLVWVHRKTASVSTFVLSKAGVACFSEDQLVQYLRSELWRWFGGFSLLFQRWISVELEL